jgi:hypothetical protein
MNATIRNLIIAAPLATAALTMVPAAAMATEPGPVIIAQPHTDPTPDLDIAAAPSEPVEPKGPQDKAPAPKPEAPDDKVGPAPQPTQPDGPDDITNPQPCPTHGVDCTSDQDEPKGDDEPKGGESKGGESKNTVDDVVDAIQVPSRVDAGLASEQGDGGLDVAWLFAGGLAVTASGAALAVRRRTGTKA